MTKIGNQITAPLHGGRLVNLMIDGPGQREKLIEESKSLSKLKMSTLEFSDLIMLGIGAYKDTAHFTLSREGYMGYYPKLWYSILQPLQRRLPFTGCCYNISKDVRYPSMGTGS